MIKLSITAKIRIIIITLTALIVLIMSCTESPLQPITNSITGGWGGTSTVIYPGPDGSPALASADIFILFFENGVFEYYQHYTGFGTPPSLEFQGTFHIKGDSVVLNIDYDFHHSSPLGLDGTFWFEVNDSVLNMQQIVGGDSPKTHNVHFIPWADFEAILPFLGYWEGMSKVTYPGAADEPISDSIEVMFFFQMDGIYSFGSLGDSLSDPVIDPFIIGGTYEATADTITLDFPIEILNRHPLYLKGDFAWTAIGDSLNLLQQPPGGAWSDVYEVRLKRPPYPN